MRLRLDTRKNFRLSECSLQTTGILPKTLSFFRTQLPSPPAFCKGPDNPHPALAPHAPYNIRLPFPLHPPALRPASSSLFTLLSTAALDSGVV